MKRVVVACAVALATAVGGRAEADVTFSTILPGDVYNPAVAYSPGVGGIAANGELGFSFVAGVSGGLAQIRTSIFRRTASTGPVMLRLYSDAGGPPGQDVPGTLMGEWSAGGLGFWPHVTVQPLATVALDGSVQVSAGQTYFFVVVDPTSTTQWAWTLAGTQGNSTNAHQVYRGPGGSWEHDQQPITGIEVSVVPAPGAGVVLMVGGMVGSRRRRRNCEGAAAVV